MTVNAKILTLDVDDERDINAAIAHFQLVNAKHNGAFLPEGWSCLAGAILGEICRGRLEERGALYQEPQ